MSSYDLSSLPPADAIVALRSFPRRYRERAAAARRRREHRRAGSTHRARRAQRRRPDRRHGAGRGPSSRRPSARSAWRRHPVVHPATVDRASRRDWGASVHETLPDALNQLDERAGALADEAAHFSANDWTRSGAAAGGGAVSALDVVRAAVRTGRDNLVAAERALDAHGAADGPGSTSGGRTSPRGCPRRTTRRPRRRRRRPAPGPACPADRRRSRAGCATSAG